MTEKNASKRVKDGDTVCFIKEHMVETWEAVTIEMPLAGWFNLALSTGHFRENKDYFIIPWDDDLRDEIKEVFAEQGNYENILFVIKLKQEDADKACQMAKQEPEFIKEDRELYELTGGQCDNSLHGFACVGRGYVSVNSQDMEALFDNAIKRLQTKE